MNNVEILEVRKADALLAHKEGDDRDKALLERLYGKKHFLTNIMDRIKGWDDILVELGRSADDPRYIEGEPDEIAFRMAKDFTALLNEGWTPNWNNSSEYKYFQWWYMDSPGFRLLAVGLWLSGSDTGAGSRLCFKSRALAEYAAKIFLPIYKQLNTNEKCL